MAKKVAYEWQSQYLLLAFGDLKECDVVISASIMCPSLQHQAGVTDLKDYAWVIPVSLVLAHDVIGGSESKRI